MDDEFWPRKHEPDFTHDFIVFMLSLAVLITVGIMYSVCST